MNAGYHDVNDEGDWPEICATFGNNGVSNHLPPVTGSAALDTGPITLRPIHPSCLLHISQEPTTMFRSAILRSQLPAFRSAALASVRPAVARPTPVFLSRGYAAAAGLSKDDISSRVLEVMKSFEKVDGGKVGPCVQQRANAKAR